MSASFDSNHVTKLGELYDFLTGIWNKCKNKFAAKSDLATVATSGSYNDLSNKPTIPTATSDLTNDSGFITLSDVPAQVQSDWNESDTTDPAYIQNKPTIPVVPTTDQTYDSTSSNPQSGTAVAGAIAGVNQVPTSTSSDSGKVLTVDSNGSPEWQTAGGGESINAINPIYKNGSDVGLKLLNSDSGLEVVQQEHKSASATWVPDQGLGTDYFVVSLADVSLYTSSDARLVVTGCYPQYFAPSSGYYKVFLIQGNDPSSIDSSTPYAYSSSDWQEGMSLDSVLLEGGSLSFNTYNDFSFDSEFMLFFVDSYYGGDASGVIGSSELLTWSSGEATLKWVLENVYTDYGLKTAADQTYNPSSTNAQSGVAIAGALANKQDNMVVLKYGVSTWNDFITAYNKNAVLYCRVQPSTNNYRLAHLSYLNLTSTVSENRAEFWFTRSIATHTASDQCDEVIVYTLKYDNTWTTVTREMCLQGIAGNGITRTVTTSAGAGTIAWSVKPATNGGVNVDSNGVSVDVKEAPSDGKEYVRKNGAWVENYSVLYSGTATNEVRNMSLNPFDYDELKLFLSIGGVKRIYSLGLKEIAGPFTLVLKVYDGASNLWERWIQLTFTTNSVTVNATKRYKMGTISNTTATPSDVATSTTASELQFISKIIGINY